MKNIIASFLLFLSQSVLAAELVRIENSPNNSCSEFGCMYDEWKLKSDENIRFVISGYEDGSDCRFYKVNEAGEYSVILDVSPIIIDSKGKHWWGYAWDILDIPIEYKDGKVYVLATFEHDQIRDGNFNPPSWQQRFPVVKLHGKKTQWNFEQPKYQYKLVSLDSLAESAK
jgi:hypothetical protein